MTSDSSQVKTELDEDKLRRLEELNHKEQRERYIDIVNVHAAALNASQAHDRTYRSHDDTFTKADGFNDNEDNGNLMDMYGFGQKSPKDVRATGAIAMIGDDGEYMAVKNF